MKVFYDGRNAVAGDDEVEIADFVIPVKGEARDTRPEKTVVFGF